MSEDEYKDKTCGECSYLTDKAHIRYAEITEEDAGLCRLHILHNNFAIMLRNEIACPEFVSRS